MNQIDTFDRLMPKYLQYFIDGYNTNVLAYGQTGTGKTFSMVAPAGLVKKNMHPGDSIPDEFGLFLRTCLTLYHQLKDSKDSLMTMQANEIGMMELRDLLNKQPLKIDDAKNELIGSEEVIINSVDDIMKVAYQVENERYSAATAMNLNSSRCHAMVSFRRYRK